MSIFKAYDIRGVYPKELDEEMAKRIGNAFAQLVKADNIVVARDVRLSSPSITESLIEGITDFGADVVNIGLSTTPMSYFANGYLDAGGSIMVTASHNPPEYIGFKLCEESAIPLSGESGIEKIVQDGQYLKEGSKGAVSQKEIFSEYKKHILSFAKNIKPLNIVIDAGNGMAGMFLSEIFKELPCKLQPLYFEPDGTFPNHEPNPLRLETLKTLQEKIAEIDADLGIAFDGDADRCTFIDEKSQIISNDLIIAFIAKEVLKEEKGAHIVFDVRSSWAVAEEIEARGGKPIKERVGHFFIRKRLRKLNSPFGGELAGHYYFRENYFSDCAFLAMIKMLNIISAENKSVSEIVKPLKRYFATGEINFEVKDKLAKIKEIEKIFSDAEIERIDGASFYYKDFWFNVRPSNTEPLLRLNLEAKTKELMENTRSKLIALLGSPV